MDAKSKQIIARWLERGKATEEPEAEAPKLKQQKPEAMRQLPIWDEDQRGAPAAVLRSALFGIVRRGRRAAVEDALLAAWPGVQVRYTGFRLDQGDLDCWLEAVHLGRQYPLGSDVRFVARGFLRSIGRKGDGNSLRWFRRSIGRMQACGVNIRFADGREYQGPLIQDFFRDKASGRYVVRLNPLLVQLFDDAFVKLSIEKRLLLGTELARWLQGYVQSHKATEAHPHRIGLGQLQGLCGSELARQCDFRKKVRNAMRELEAQEIVSRWRITEGDALEYARP